MIADEVSVNRETVGLILTKEDTKNLCQDVVQESHRERTRGTALARFMAFQCTTALLQPP
jgi:hypothetical protein